MWRHQRSSHLEKGRLSLGKNKNLDEVTQGDGRNEKQDHGFDGTHAKTLQAQKQQYVQRRYDDSPKRREVGHEVEREGGGQDLGQIAGADGDFTHQPVGPASPRGIPIAAALRKILAGDDAQTGGNDLHEDGHKAGQSHDPQEPILELSAALEVSAPVAGVHVAYADENRGADKGAPLLPESGLMVGDVDGTVYALEGSMATGQNIGSNTDRRGDLYGLVFPCHLRSSNDPWISHADKGMLGSIHQNRLTIVNMWMKHLSLRNTPYSGQSSHVRVWRSVSKPRPLNH